VSGDPKGRASQVWDYLCSFEQGLNRRNVRLRIQTDKERFEDFHIDWQHSGVELMVVHQGIRRKPLDAAKRAMPESLPDTTGNIARKYGFFVEVSSTPARILARYRDVESTLWKASKSRQLQGDPNTSPRIEPQPAHQPRGSLHNEPANYFSDWTAHKQRKHLFRTSRL
jgi:hypothetical protein